MRNWPPRGCNYLATEQGRRARQAYKWPNADSLVLGARRESPRFLPDLHVRASAKPGPELRVGNLQQRDTRRPCTPWDDVDLITRRWSSPYVQLSCSWKATRSAVAC